MKALYKLLLAVSLVWSFGLQAQTVYTFTNCGATGRYGPTQSQVNNTYTSGNTLNSAVSINTQGVQEWTVPATGLYRIQALGAVGGKGVYQGGINNSPGQGASITGEFNLTAGTQLRIVVGQAGTTKNHTESNTQYGGSGGGGSFVWINPSNLLIAAGGGGGSMNYSYSNSSCLPGGDGLTANSGGNACIGGSGGTSGAGGAGANSYGGAGGAGWVSNGANTSNNQQQGGRTKFTFIGGENYYYSGTNYGVHGGFGGGGAAMHGGGGGGGYSGGGGGDNSASGGAGGGSYNSGSNQTNIAGSNSGHGQVIITKLYYVDITQTSTVDCNGDNTGALTALATGGSSPYTYAWSNGATTASISGLAAGTYTVTATDASSATTVNSFTITEPTALVSSSVVNSNISCYNGSNGSATASASGGTTPYTYSWNTGATTASINSITAGTYSVTITDGNGCTDSSSVTVTEPTALIATSVLDSNDAGNGGGATASATGGTPSYTYSWSNGATTATIAGVSAATYSVTITDANGCTDSASTVILAGPVFTVTVDSNASCNGTNTGGASANVSAGTSPFTYSWSNGATTASITGIGAGTYTVTVTDNNGISDTGSVTITEPTAIAINGANSSVLYSETFVGGQSYCIGTPQHDNWASFRASLDLAPGSYTELKVYNNLGASFTLTDQAAIDQIASALKNYTTTSVNVGGVSWSVTTGCGSCSGSTNNNIELLVGITSGCSCGSSSSQAVIRPGIGNSNWGGIGGATCGASTQTMNVEFVETTVKHVTCNGGNDGRIAYNFEGGFTPYSFAWSNGATTQNITSLTAGTYTVTVTDANGCNFIQDTVITQPTLLVATSVLDSNDAGNGGGATVSATGGTTPYVYAWSNGATTSTIAGVAANTYYVTVTDSNGCTDTDSTVILAGPVFTIAVDSNVSCNSGTDGGATVTVTGGTSPFTYLWSNGATTASLTAVGAGTYTLTVTDNNGISDTGSVTITEPTVLGSSSLVDANVSCNGGSNGGATASATGGTTPYAYLWSNGATTATITGVVAGTYTATVTDANGCTSTTSSTITEPAALVASSSVDANVSCNGLSNGGATASATGGTTPYTYAWSNGATTATITGVAAGTYTATVTDANGCTSTASSTITEPALLVAASVVDSNVSCNSLLDGGATSSATGGTAPYTYLWSNGATTASITGVAAGTYTATVTDANGCTSTTSSTITEPTLLVAASAVDSNVSCNGGTDGGATASATGGTTPYAYLWSNGATTASITGVAAGTYTATVTDANGCTSTSSSIVTEPTLLVASSVIDANVTCNGGMDGAATAAATGGTTGYTFAWSNGASTASITGLAAGTYTATVTDANGCSTTTTATVTEPAPLPATVMIDSNVTCNGGMNGGATASVSGGTSPYTYLWNNGATTASITGLAAGVYSTTVTDANGCISNGSDTITEPTAITLMDSTIMPLCNGDSNGSAYVMSMGGTGAHTYAWSNGSMVDSIANAGAGTYTVSVTDANGCEVPFTVTINEPTVLGFNIDEVKDTKCEFGTTGFVKTTTFGGTAPYYYAWSNTDTVEDAYNLGAGMYYLTVTDTNGCTAVDSAYVDYINAAPIFTINGKDTACFGEVNNLSVLGVAGWNWSTGSTTASTAADTTGTYSVTVTDHLGCENFGSFDVYVNAAIELNVAATDANCEFGTNGSAVATATGGSSNFEYAWSTGANTASADLAIGTHEVMVTDMIGCQDSAEVVIGFVNENPTIAFPADTTVCEKTVFTLDPGVAGGTYMWNTGDTTSTIQVSMAGTYGVALTDANGCGAEDSVVVNYDNCNGVEEGQAISMAVYPNPSRGMFNVSLNGYAGSVELSVLDITGKQVMNAQRVVTNNEVIELDLDQAAGVYFLRLNITDKTLYKQLIIE